MNSNVIANYSKLKPALFVVPLFLLVAIVAFLYSRDSLTVDRYIQIQKDSFFYINHSLGSCPILQFNLTQLGDASICLSLLTIFIIYAPKMWECLISASLVSAIFSNLLKKIFAVPRPASSFEIGRAHV